MTVPWHGPSACVCRLSHSCTLLKPQDGIRCYLAETNDGVTSNIVLDGPLCPMENPIFGLRNYPTENAL